MSKRTRPRKTQAETGIAESVPSPTESTSASAKVTMELTEREAALILLIRRVQFGKLMRISIRNGEPHAIDFRPDPDGLPISQQLDFSDITNLNRVMRALVSNEDPHR